MGQPLSWRRSMSKVPSARCGSTSLGLPLTTSWGPQHAYPVYTQLLGVKTRVSWCGKVGSEWIHLRIGCREGTTEMPLLWQCVVVHVLAPLLESWCRRGTRVAILAMGATCTVSHAQPRSGHLSHFAWADGIMLASDKLKYLQSIVKTRSPLYSTWGSGFHATSFACGSPDAPPPLLSWALQIRPQMV